MTSAPRHTAPPVSAPPDRITHGAVHLRVTDVPRAVEFWGDALGLGVRDRAGDRVHLGTPARDLVVLHGGATRRAPRGHAGLYHLAVHVPDAQDFARALVRLATHRVAQAPTDHIFSIATYAHDPDGLGLEVTHETPARVVGHEITDRGVALIDDEGRRRAPTEALDPAPLLDAVAGEAPTPRVDDRSFIGHVHLHVDDIGRAVAFYRDVVGFDEHMRMDGFGMADFSAGGVFPHRMAVNVWQGAGAPPTPADAAGLVFHELLADAAGVDALAGRLDAAGHPFTRRDGGISTLDPAGNTLVVMPRGAV